MLLCWKTPAESVQKCFMLLPRVLRWQIDGSQQLEFNSEVSDFLPPHCGFVSCYMSFTSIIRRLQ